MRGSGPNAYEVLVVPGIGRYVFDPDTLGLDFYGYRWRTPMQVAMLTVETSPDGRSVLGPDECARLSALRAEERRVRHGRERPPEPGEAW